MIKAIFFDFDGVLTTDKSGSLTTLRSISRQTGIAETVLWEAFAPFNQDLLLGHRTHADVWQEVCNAVGESISFETLEAAFLDTPMNQTMLELARDLGERYRTGIITDNKSDRVDYLREHHDLESMFDPIVVSADVGSGKDQPDIFLRALDHLGIAAAEAIFIDNTEKNLIAPSTLGMGTIYFDDGRNDVSGLRATIEKMCAMAV